MYALCTYCSKHKSETPGHAPAIERYLDERIHKVCEAAKLLGLDFYILSGEYGLIPPDQPIPWYDRLLRPDEVERLAERMADQIRQYGVEGIIYLTNPVSEDGRLVPYRAAMLAACRLVSCPCTVVQVRLNDVR